MARTAVAPNETHASDGLWTYSTVPEYKGWMWKADTSSDEVINHALGLSTYAAYMPSGNGTGVDGSAEEAAQILTNILVYIVENGFRLIDFNGKMTTWGDWSPVGLNTRRDISDDRGVNALEILAMLADAIGLSDMLPTNATRDALLEEGWEVLTDQNQYLLHIINQKIEAPIDVSHDDDDQSFTAYYSWLVSGRHTNVSVARDGIPAALSSLARHFDYILPERSDQW